MLIRSRAAMPAFVTVLGIAVAFSGAPSGNADPGSAAQEASGTFRVVFDNSHESARTWQISASCAPDVSAPCVQVIGNGRAVTNAVLAGGNWSFGSSYPDGTCSNPPMKTTTWSWNPASLTGTIVDHVDAGCGLPEHTETYSNFTMTRTA